MGHNAAMDATRVKRSVERDVQAGALPHVSQQLNSASPSRRGGTDQEARGGSQYKSVTTSHKRTALRPYLRKLSSKVSFMGDVKGREQLHHRGLYSVRQFQNNLVWALVMRNTKRFARLLKKYTVCCRSGRVVDTSGDMPSSQLMVKKRRSEAEEDCHRMGDPLPCGCADDENTNDSDVFCSLVDRVVDFTTGYTMTHFAVISGMRSFVKSCLSFGSAVHSHEDLNGDTALSLALWVQPEMVFTMLRLGCDVNIARVNMKGRNLLHNAVSLTPETPRWSRRFDFIKELVARTPTLTSARDLFGFTPAALAMEHADCFSSKEEYMNIVTFLRDAEVANKTSTVMVRAEGGNKAGCRKEETDDVTLKEFVDERPLAADAPGHPRTVHTETLLSDRVRFVMEGPPTRLLCILILLALHILEYAVDVADRGKETLYRDAQCGVWLIVFNNIASCWAGSSFFMGLTHFLCSFGAALVGACVYHRLVHVLFGKILMRLPFCGCQGAAEKRFILESFSEAYLALGIGADRGRYFAFVVGGFLGVYGGAHVYNTLLNRFWPGQVSWAHIHSTLSGIDAAMAFRGFWLATVIMDWYIFMFVFDVMYQQGSLNIYLPHHTFGGFAALINGLRHLRRQTILEKDISTACMGIYWTFLLLGWGVIAAVFFLPPELMRGHARELIVEPFFSVSWVGTPVALASMCIFLECIIACQEWTWPTFQEHPFLHFPGLAIATHHAWFLMLLLIVQSTLDLRIIQAHVELLMGDSGDMASGDAVLLFITLIPAALGVTALLVFIIRSSLWWEKCGAYSKIIPMYSEHMRLKPCSLQNEAAAMLATHANKQLRSKLLRSLVLRMGVKGLKETMKTHKAMRQTRAQMLRFSLEADKSHRSCHVQKRNSVGAESHGGQSLPLHFWGRIRGVGNNGSNDSSPKVSISLSTNESPPSSPSVVIDIRGSQGREREMTCTAQV